jgi:hypothetical protein
MRATAAGLPRHESNKDDLPIPRLGNSARSTPL